MAIPTDKGIAAVYYEGTSIPLQSVLKTITASNASGVQVDIDENWFVTYDTVVVCPDITLSSQDWLYVLTDSMSVDGQCYTTKGTYFDESFKTIISLGQDDAVYCTSYLGRDFRTREVSSYLYFKPYDSGTTVGGKITIYGGTSCTSKNETIVKKITNQLVTLNINCEGRGIGSRAIDSCTSLVTAHISNFTGLGQGSNGYTFNGCSALKTVVLVTEHTRFNSGAYLISNCPNVEKFDMTGLNVVGSMFATADKNSFKTLIIRDTSVVSLSNLNAFANTPYYSGGSGGAIYIPKSLYDHLGDGTSNDYKAATNWATYDAYGTITWMQIEGSQYEHYYADGTPVE